MSKLKQVHAWIAAVSLETDTTIKEFRAENPGGGIELAPVANFRIFHNLKEKIIPCFNHAMFFSSCS